VVNCLDLISFSIFFNNCSPLVKIGGSFWCYRESNFTPGYYLAVCAAIAFRIDFLSEDDVYLFDWFGRLSESSVLCCTLPYDTSFIILTAEPYFFLSSQSAFLLFSSWMCLCFLGLSVMRFYTAGGGGSSAILVIVFRFSGTALGVAEFYLRSF
jgi:hypothetical protein